MALADKYYTIGVLGKSFGVIELMASGRERTAEIPQGIARDKAGADHG